MKAIEIKVVNTGKQPLPEYAKPGDAGMDLRANIDEPVTLLPLDRHLFPTGLHIQLPEGYVAMVHPRSGLAIKHGITCANAVGVVDAGYRGDVGVELINLSREPFTVNPGERIAQLIIQEFVQGVFVPVEKLDESERGDGGFGHTGK
jgi:dUTP pyrophosphatase